MITTDEKTIECSEADANLTEARGHIKMTADDAAIIREILLEADRKYAARLASKVDPLLALYGSMKDNPAFKDGGVAYQRRMRDGWDD